MDIERLLRAMVEQEASDLLLKVGSPPYLRINGKLIPIGNQAIEESSLSDFSTELMGPHRRQMFHADRELNFAFDRPGIGRFRANILWQRGTMAIVIRRIRAAVLTFNELNLPAKVLERFMGERSGLILITGPVGSGKSTTAAAMLEFINTHTSKHILTLEDPIEYLFEERQAIINQREIGNDTRSFSEGLRNALRQSPDILFLSDIRDREAMESCLLAAEAGQLVLSCIHTTNIMTTIERIIAFFPAHQHSLIRLRLAQVLRGIVSLRMLLRRDGIGRIPACEVLVVTPTIREFLRQGHTEKVTAVLQDGAMYGMQTFTQALYQRYRQGDVDLEEALKAADSPEELQLAVREIRSTKDIELP
ncbi:MAG: PilT/PilU family type 4a pilus ATPase [Candidatus Omnitrophica bacterium]|nr:PilT/PilU family type 4a pilus ATPase [Candidatus Omnitrophota bacterium]